MPNLGTYIPVNCQGPIGNHIPGGWAAFPVNTPVLAKSVAAPVTKTIAGRIEIHAPANWLNGNQTEVRDTLIFEAINVIQKPALDALQNNFATNAQTLANYGQAYSDIEAATTWLAGHIFDDMAIAGIGLSNWATGLRNDVMQVGLYPNLGAYQGHFAATPQDPQAQDQRQLPSQELYQFEWVSRKGSSIIAKKIAAQWLAAQIGNLSNQGSITSNSPREKMLNRIRELTDPITNFDAGTKGRVEIYNAALVALSTDNRLNPPAAFLNTASYLCPSY